MNVRTQFDLNVCGEGFGKIFMNYFWYQSKVPRETPTDYGSCLTSPLLLKINVFSCLR